MILRKENFTMFISTLVIFLAVCLIFNIGNKITLSPPQQVFFCLTIILLSLLGIIERRNEHDNKSEIVSLILGISVVFVLTLGLISFSAFYAPGFFKSIGFTVNDANSTSDHSLGIVSASDATGIFSSSMFTAVIAYIFWELENSKKKEK